MEEIYSAQKVEHINDYLFIDTYKSNKIKVGKWYDGELVWDEKTKLGQYRR